MKKLFLFAVALLVLPISSFATTTVTENFDSYTNGASLVGANGGFGWSSAWTIVGGFR